MEKRRNTLDRWQRLRFGRRAASNPPEEKKPSSPGPETATISKRSSDKTERLRELTELLKGTRHQAMAPSDGTMSPPVPPPRKPRQPNVDNSTCNVEKFIDTSASESGSPVAGTKLNHTVEMSIHPLIDSLRPNTSVSNLETMMHRQKTKEEINKLPIVEQNSLFSEQPLSAVTAVSSGTSEFLPRAESRPLIVGAYTQKAIPFRSASFSQVDYSSGKYIRSALGALKASLTKSKSPPVVDNCTNLTLPRSSKDRSRSPSPLHDIAPIPPPLPPYDIWIPLKPMPTSNATPIEKSSARNDLNLNLLGATSANIIMEEDNENSPTADSKESKYTVPIVPINDGISLKIEQAAQMSIDPFSDGEIIAMQSPEDYFQTATTCMIPVPVYECNLRDWVDANLADQWINACEIDTAKIVEEVKVDAQQVNDDELPRFLKQSDACNNNNKSPDILINEALSESEHYSTCDKYVASNLQSPTLDLDDVPAIAVTPGSSISGSSFDEIEQPHSATESEKNDNVASNATTATDYIVEVRKRYSNDENRNSDNAQSTSGSGTSSPKCNLDDKRRIDKSKRRKGIYIQWAALDKHNKELNTLPWDGDVNSSQENSSSILQDIGGGDDMGEPLWPLPVTAASAKMNRKEGYSSMESESDVVDFRTAVTDKLNQRIDDDDKTTAWLNCTSTDEVQTPGSFEATSPDSEYNRPVWPKDAAKVRRQSFSLQSSEEKDESPAASSPPSKAHAKLFVLRSDSISDNELSDRTPPPRERASQSPAPCEQDLKRYSKRPLRGPYGQMLEAEMKKPNKQNYDGLLEELNRAER